MHLNYGRVNLGVGKPYDEDIDMRLEDWMSLRDL